jgi:benzodiazapine receptor
MADGRSIAKLAGAVAACEAAGGIGAFLSREGLQEWYPKLHKPSFNPPDWVFGPTWTLLYALMGTSLWLVEERGEDGAVKRTSRVFFGAQLLLNVLWTHVFFGRRSPGWAFVEVLVLLATIAATVASFSKVCRTAALLLVPYLLWTGFASVLTFCIWRLNR